MEGGMAGFCLCKQQQIYSPLGRANYKYQYCVQNALAETKLIKFGSLWFILCSPVLSIWHECWCVGETVAATEQHTEHASELSAHGAVDEEIERTGDGNTAVDDERGGVARRVAKHVNVERVFDDDEQQQDRQRHFHGPSASDVLDSGTSTSRNTPTTVVSIAVALVDGSPPVLLPTLPY